MRILLKIVITSCLLILLYGSASASFLRVDFGGYAYLEGSNYQTSFQGYFDLDVSIATPGASYTPVDPNLQFGAEFTVNGEDPLSWTDDYTVFINFGIDSKVSAWDFYTPDVIISGTTDPLEDSLTFVRGTFTPPTENPIENPFDFDGIKRYSLDGVWGQWLNITPEALPFPGSNPVPDSNPVPEPATMVLFGLGLLGLAGVSRRKQ